MADRRRQRQHDHLRRRERFRRPGHGRQWRVDPFRFEHLSGGTAINGGTLSIASTNCLPGWNISGSYSVAAGAALAVGNAVTDSNITAILATNNFAGSASLGFDTTAGNRTYAGTLANTASGSLGLFKIGANTLYLTGTNTFTGGVNVAAGTLNFSPSALNGLNNTVSFNGGTLQWAAGNTQDISSKINIGSSSQTACLDTNGNSVTFSSAISGAGGLTVTGSSNLSLKAFNTYTGLTTISAGTLTAAEADNTGNKNTGTFSAAGAGITIGPGGTLVASQVGAIFGHGRCARHRHELGHDHQLGTHDRYGRGKRKSWTLDALWRHDGSDRNGRC